MNRIPPPNTIFSALLHEQIEQRHEQQFEMLNDLVWLHEKGKRGRKLAALRKEAAKLQAETETEGRIHTLAEMERMLIARALERNPKSKAMAARELGICPNSLYTKITRYKLASPNV